MRKIGELTEEQKQRLRDLTEEEKKRDLENERFYGNRPEVLSLDEWEQKIRLAQWYMRKAGMSVGEEVSLMDKGTYSFKWLLIGITIAALYMLVVSMAFR